MSSVSNREFEEITNYVKKNFGISLGQEKKTLVYSRLNDILRELGLKNLKEYFDYISNDKTGKEVRRFVDRITTNHTFFMREAEHFDFLMKNVFPELEKKHSGSKDVRVWCAGCSSGEEAYTLQILLKEYFGEKGWNTEILATDISIGVLEKAYKGVYSEESLKKFPEQWKKKYFNKFDDQNMIVTDELKKEIIFRKINLIDFNLSFKRKLQVVFCRNVMIYFDNPDRDKLVNKFYNITEDGGYLFIGHSESISHANTGYQYVGPAIYKKS